ncbi:MAG: putative metal-binding motif-containing protein [Pseudomonadota bacterium]|nr:putative metal-binding motif-containing protein [Pseudomonadota bacterium]
MRPTLVLLGLLSLACGTGKPAAEEEESRTIFDDQDNDDDGYPYTEDCNDEVASINPGADEVCDPGDVDENCNSLADEADPGVTGGITAYPDRDADGFGDGDTPVTVCAIGGGYVVDSADCDDTDPAINPTATEACDDANVDEDCDGGADDADPEDATGKGQAWYDGDGDGVGDNAGTRCDLVGGWVDQRGDCDDDDAAVEPDAIEMCDGIDNDCDGAVDPTSAVDAPTWYRDSDGDGYGDPEDDRIACTAPSGYVADDTDCDDAEITAHPGGTESCDDADNDCNGTVDDGAYDAPTWYRDSDGDGYGTTASTRMQCDAPGGYAANDDDCNDGSAAISPGEAEACDSADTDEDCDGLEDDADSPPSGRTTWYRDADGDRYGLTASTSSACDVPTGYTSVGGDCDDASAAENPGATEVCDASNTDEDCDSRADDADTSVSSSTKTSFYSDSDRDGYGAGSATAYCDAPSAAYSSATGDCSVSDPAINPGATEVCGGVDDDCDGLVDEADSSLDADAWYVDADEDGYGDDRGVVIHACTEPSGYAAFGDCDDTDPATHAGAEELCFDGIDNNCDGIDSCAGNTNDAEFTMTGTSSYGYTTFGIDVAFLGDIDGDGVGDVAVANSLGADYYGTIEVFSGASTGSLRSADALLTGVGPQASAQFGATIVAVDDVTGDGLPDLWVGDYRYDLDTVYDVGAASLLDGADLSEITRLTGSVASDWFGTDFLALGDIDDDGVDEMLLGGNLSDGPGYKGVAYVVDATVTGESVVDDVAQSRLYGDSSMIVGGELCDLGDLDGDGTDEVGLSGFASSNGRTVIVSEFPAGDVDISRENYFSSGYTVDCEGGDVTGDGYSDALILHHAGLTYTLSLVRGPISATTVVASAAVANFQPNYTGSSSAAPIVLDLDGDGDLEWVTGSPAGRGTLLGFDGTETGTLDADDAILRIDGYDSRNQIGTSYRFGDLEGDGDTEILVGGQGSAWLFRYSGL